MKFNNLQEALAIDKKQTVTTLDLSNLKIKEISPEIGEFYNLRVLNLHNNQLTKLPVEIGKLRNLSTLNLNKNQLTVLPSEFSQLTKLHRLELNHNQLTKLPANLKALSKLNHLLVQDNKLKNLPNGFAQLTELKTLNICNNQLAMFPEDIVQLTQLTSLLVHGNQFTKMPQEVFHMSNLREVTGLSKLKRVSPKAILTKFKETYQNTDFSEDAYQEFLSIFLGKDAEVAELPTLRLFDALTITNQTLRKHALEYILQLPQANFGKKPLTEKSTLTFVGDTFFKKSEVREKLKNNNIGYSPKITPKTSHVVVGYNPKDYSGVAKKKYTYLSEVQLNNFLNEIATPYLLEQEEPDANNVDNLKNLLTSTDPANMGVAIEILKGGGVPNELFTELFFATKITGDKKVREKAKELLSLNGTKSIQKALKHKEKLGSGSSSYDAEKKVYKKLRKYATLSKDIHWGKIAWYHYQHFNNGLRFLFDYEPVGNDLRKEVLQALVQGTQLDFYAAYATYMPTYAAEYAYSYYQPKPFPTDVLELTHITELNIAGCYIDEIPDNINQLNKLQTLTCDGNFISRLPDSFAALKSLHTLNIANNEFKEFPMVLAKMPQLHKVIFRNNRNKWEYNEIAIPDEVKAALPDCEFVGWDHLKD